MLLDAHTLLWFMADDSKLLPEVREMIEGADRIYSFPCIGQR